MRTIGLARSAFDMMCERALSRETQGSVLADKQFVQGYIADSYAQLMQFRLFVLYTAWSIDKHNDYRKVRKDIAAVKVLMPGCCTTSPGAMQVHGALGVSNEMPFHRMMLGASVLGLADGPTEVHKVTVARQVLRDHRPSDDLWPTGTCPSCWRRPRPSTPSTSSTKWGTCDRHRPARHLDGRRRPRQGRAARAPVHLGRHAERDLRDPAGDLHAAAHPAPEARRRRDDGIVREWRIIEALGGTDVPHTEALAVCTDPAVLGRTFYLMGYVDGWSPMGRKGWPAPFDADLAARRGLAFELVDGIALLSKVDWRAKGLDDLGAPTASTSARSTAGPLPRPHQGPRAARLRRGLRLAAGAQAARLRARDHARRLPVRQRDVPRRRAGPPGRHRRLGDGHGRRPKLDLAGSCTAGPTTGRTRRRVRQLRRHDRHAVALEMLARYAEVSGRQVDDIDYYVVLAKWKLAVVLEQGFQRAGDDEKLLAFGPIVLQLMQEAAGAANRRSTGRDRDWRRHRARGRAARRRGGAARPARRPQR